MNIEEVKKLIEGELAPIKLKLIDFEKKIHETTSLEFLDKKYDQLVEHSKTTNGKINSVCGESKSAKETITKLQDAMAQTKNAIDDLAQYLRRDCVEITGIQADNEPEAEEIVQAIAQDMGIEISEDDISTAHPLPTFSERSDD